MSRHDVDFIVVGGVAAILEGVPITTLDLDVVHDRSPENLQRLLEALQTVEASYRDPAGRHIVPTVEMLATFRMNLLRTSLGPLDVIASIHGAEYQANCEPGSSSSSRRLNGCLALIEVESGLPCTASGRAFPSPLQPC